MTSGLGDDNFYLTPKAKTTTKNKYVELNQTKQKQKQKKTLLYDKGNLQQNKTATHWMGENFSNNISDKELIFKVYKEFIQPPPKKKLNKNPILKMGRRSE